METVYFSDWFPALWAYGTSGLFGVDLGMPIDKLRLETQMTGLRGIPRLGTRRLCPGSRNAVWISGPLNPGAALPLPIGGGRRLPVFSSGSMLHSVQRLLMVQTEQNLFWMIDEESGRRAQFNTGGNGFHPYCPCLHPGPFADLFSTSVSLRVAILPGLMANLLCGASIPRSRWHCP